MKKEFLNSLNYIKTFLKWTLIATVIGIVGGIVGSLFHISVDLATEARTHNGWLLYLLPLGGVLIVVISKLCRAVGAMDTNKVIDAVRTNSEVSFIMAPLIFISTFITHLFGGSAGREGAALQLGGSIGYRIGKLFRLSNRDLHLVVMSGMSAVFTALFGTPLAATVFAIEVTSVGVMYYVALVPCVIASFTASLVSGWFGVLPVRFAIDFGETSVIIMIQAIIIAIACGVVSILFCVLIKKGEHYFKKYLKNEIVRAFAGGALIVLLTVILNTTDYNGAGMEIIARAIQGEARPEAFILKIIFTVITISAGFKGGEIVPTFFIGSTLGCVLGSLLGLNSSIGSAVGFVAMFCGVTNCPIASVLLSIEIFGADFALVFGVVCAVSYMMSGYTSLYKSQKIMYSKLEARYINQETR